MTDKKADATKVVSWAIEKIKPYEKNAKIHSAEQVDKIVASIEEYGFIQYVTVDENGVILAGHGRRLAAIQMGMKSLPVLVVSDLTEKQKKAYRIADNKVVSVTYDETLLGNEIKELLTATEHDLMFMDIASLGMDSVELDVIFEKFSIDEISGMVADDIADVALGEVADEVKPKSEVKEVEYEKSYTVSVDCSGEDEQLELYNQLTAEGRACRIMTM